MNSNSEPLYIISIAARILGTETHVLRYFEKLQLIQPRRSSGNIRLYSQDDIDHLRYIKTLMCDLGVNLAGVEVALHLMQRMEELQQQLEQKENIIKRLMGIDVSEELDIEFREE
jgi:MerR family transcriptional regulator, heat shock protein HspR